MQEKLLFSIGCRGDGNIMLFKEGDIFLGSIRILVVGRIGYIRSLIVKKNHRFCGYGSALLQLCFHCSRVDLICLSSAKNNLEFYRKNGFSAKNDKLVSMTYSLTCKRPDFNFNESLVFEKIKNKESERIFSMPSNVWVSDDLV